MKVTIEIQCDNTAFTYESGTEVYRILTSLDIYARDLLPDEDIPLHDINGNKVGWLMVSDEQ